MRYLRPRNLLLLGVILIVSGFLYDLFFAGLPYQDVSPEKELAWKQNKEIAATVMKAGFLTAVAGTGLKIFNYFKKKQG
ncbi:MAG: hypothetical protein AAGA53_07865 [Pseudomonadota bacterium]